MQIFINTVTKYVSALIARSILFIAAESRATHAKRYSPTAEAGVASCESTTPTFGWLGEICHKLTDAPHLTSRVHPFFIYQAT